MKKTLFRMALAAGLVGAVNWAMDGENSANAAEISAANVAVNQELYTFVPGHPLAGQQKTSQQIIEDGDCNGNLVVCATADDDQPDFRWDGNTIKF